MRHTILLFFTFVFFSTASSYASVTPYPRVPGDEPNRDYISVTVNGTPVDTVATDTLVGYAHFAMDEKVRIEITAREPITTFDLSPHRLGLREHVTINGNRLTFELNEPRKLHLRINNLSRFFIFADAPEKDAPQSNQPGIFTLTDLGVKSSPTLNQTDALQRAIDKVAARKGTLYVPPGIYRAGRVVIPSNLTLYLAPGSIIKGTGILADYKRERGETQQFHLDEAHNVRIYGRGILDNHGQQLRRNGNNVTASRSKLITTERARDITIEDVLLRGAGVWCVHMIESSDIRITNAKVISLTRAESDELVNGSFVGSNTDGFDPDNSSRITIDNCFISCDDDAIAVKLNNGSKRRDMTDIQFRKNTIWIMCSALKIGTEVYDRTLSNVVFADNDIVNADVGIAVWCWRGGTVNGARWENNHFEAIGVVPKESPHKKETNIRLTIRDVRGKGHVRNLLIKDNTFERHSPNDSMLQGLDDEHVIENVTFENLTIAGKKCATDEQARMTISRFTKNITFK